MTVFTEKVERRKRAFWKAVAAQDIRLAEGDVEDRKRSARITLPRPLLTPLSDIAGRQGLYHSITDRTLTVHF